MLSKQLSAELVYMHDNLGGAAGRFRPNAASTCALNELPVGARGRVVGVQGDPDLRRRLLEMGFCNGASVEVIRRAPLGDPIEFRLRGYHLSLRDEQAKFVRMLPEPS
ncbi:MAG TPA: FeoA family protein [Tepidisphaeraceae bacterium]|nr:FeoA family protein [Tepidisphaeraceae bacterium]